jgi:hypothetical protein
VVGSDRDVDGLLLASLLSSAVGWAAGGGMRCRRLSRQANVYVTLTPRILTPLNADVCQMLDLRILTSCLRSILIPQCKC